MIFCRAANYCYISRTIYLSDNYYFGLSRKISNLDHGTAEFTAVANNLTQPATRVENNKSWNHIIETFKEFGIEESDCRKIIPADSELLKSSQYDLKQTWSSWNKSEIGHDFVKLLILNQPNLLLVPPNYLEKRLPFILSFTKKPKAFVTVLLNNPNLVTEKWDHINEKIDYLLDEMRVEKQEIINSNALSKTIDHIKLRHRLLSMCGLYKEPNKHEHKRTKNEKSAFLNPPLKRIIDNEDKSFARKICKISPEEFEVYKCMFEDGMLRDKEEYLSDADSESDSE